MPDDEEFSSSSAELVTCIPVSTKKSFSDEVKDDTDEEAEDDKDDSDDETWRPKTIGTTSKNIIIPNKKGATSSSSPSTKKKLVNRGEPVRHCIIRDKGKAASGDQAAVSANFELLSWKVVSNVTDDKRVFKSILKKGRDVCTAKTRNTPQKRYYNDFSLDEMVDCVEMEAEYEASQPNKKEKWEEKRN
uniref:Uncharacterized protein n=1 Tax=Tanacetum cinerariifolium TaxID=118510 RepID=A0A699GXY1_TANCI|nr:hypothetical protein [Tanacetum cinerariifolium]